MVPRALFCVDGVCAGGGGREPARTDLVVCAMANALCIVDVLVVVGRLFTGFVFWRLDLVVGEWKIPVPRASTKA